MRRPPRGQWATHNRDPALRPSSSSRLATRTAAALRILLLPTFLVLLFHLMQFTVYSSSSDPSPSSSASSHRPRRLLSSNLNLSQRGVKAAAVANTFATSKSSLPQTGRGKHVLVTGGTGYIGSHTVLMLLQRGYDVTIVDNLVNSDRRVLDRLAALTGPGLPSPAFYKVDLRDEAALDEVFAASGKPVDAVVHFAGLKAVGESCRQPLRYWEHNVGGSVTLLKAMRKAGCRNLVFSSSATVYGQPETVPITEDSPLRATNPYGSTKLAIENLLRDVANGEEGEEEGKTTNGSSSSNWRIILLRYFNPIGAHPSGLIGEDPRGVPNNLLPYVCQVAVGRRQKLSVFGGDYPTRDGTGVRDYIHVCDLSEGHVLAIENGLFGGAMAADGDGGGSCEVYNLGTGRGYSVLEIVKAFERASGKKIPYDIAARRPGDVAEMFADASKARERLGFSADLGIDAMCTDAWRWQEQNPEGYSSAVPPSVGKANAPAAANSPR